MGTLVSVGSATLLVAGIILVLSHLARRRMEAPRRGGSGDSELRVVRRVGIGPRQGVALLEVGDRRFLISCGDGGVRCLGEVTGPHPPAAAGGPDPFLASSLPGSQGSTELRRTPEQPALGQGVPGWLRRALHLAGVVLLLCATPALSTSMGDAAGLVAQVAGETGVEGGGLPQMELRLGGEEAEGGLRVSGPVGAVLLIGFLTLIPTLLLLMTSFTRILIVLHLLKQALGAQAAPPAHVLTALALLLSGFVMAPTLAQVNQEALSPWMDGEMDEVEMLQTASVPLREFMMLATRDEDLGLFLDLWGEPVPEELEEVPLMVVASAFVTSELRTAFQMGFALFLPFIVIDLV
ncbi:MAG: hypothetical protein EA421_14780, partial [Gemmatimonadales bacterium]